MPDIREIAKELDDHIKQESAERWPGATLLNVVDGSGQITDGYVWCDLAGQTVRCIVPSSIDLTGNSQVIYAVPLGNGSNDFICIGLAWNGLDNSHLPRIRAAAITDINGNPAGGGSGTVSSVALSASPGGIFDVSGSPVTTSGTLALTMDNQNANVVLAGPSSGGAAAPAFRALVASDIPANLAIKENALSIVATADTIDFKDFNVEDLTGNDAGVYHDLPGIFEARVTLESGVPVSITNQTAKTVVYLTPYKGNKISLYDGTRWKKHTLSEISIKLTDAQTGTTHSGTKVIDGLTDTSQLIPGMKISGTGVGAGSVIDTIDSATQITGTVNSTASASVTVTFKVAADAVIDIWCFSNSGMPKLEMTAWTSQTARATALTLQDGVEVKNGATSRRYCGSVGTGVTDGQTEDSVQYRLVYNRYHRTLRPIAKTETTNTWTYATQTWRPANNSTANRIGILVGIAGPTISINILITTSTNVTGYYGLAGIAEDVTNTNHGNTTDMGICALNIGTTTDYTASATSYIKQPALGYHFYQWVEQAQTGCTATYYSQATTLRNAGILGTWEC